MTWFNERTDGPNTTATNTKLMYGNSESVMHMQAQDETIDGVPSRVVTNMQLDVPDVEMSKVPEYTAKGIEAELQDLSQSGRAQLVTPVNSPADSAQFKALAKRTGSEYAEKDGRGTFKPGLASVQSDLDEGFKTASALEEGYSEEEVRSYLSGKGLDQEQVDSMFTQSTRIAEARKAGYNDEEIRSYLTAGETKVASIEKEPVVFEEEEQWIPTQWGAVKKRSAYETLTSSNSISAEELLASMKVLAPNMASMTTRTMGFFGNQEAAKKAEAGALASRNKIIALAAERGLDLSWDEQLGEFVAQTAEGPKAINEGIWESLLSEKGEITGGVSGGIAGFNLTKQWGPIAAGGGSILGAAVGAAVGSQFDYLYQAIKLQEDLEGNVMAHKALTAAEVSVVGDVLGLGVFGTHSMTMKGIARVKDFLVDGNTEGAYRALKEMEYVTDEQAQELVEQLSKVSIGAPGKKAEEQAIAAIVTTKPGAEGLVAAAASVDPQASRAIGKAIDDRAKDLLKATDELSGDNIGRIMREDLGNYVADVKNFYGSVKAAAAQSPRAANFSFDYDKLALQPVIDTLQKNITDPAVLEKFKLQAERIRGMSDARTFGDLLELRQVVNEFKFNTKITKAKDFDTLNTVLSNIDGAIRSGANVVLENPKQWLKDYDKARLDYAKMKQLERNVMYKALTREGISEKDVVRSLSKYITALDGTYNDLVSKLPKDMKHRVEAATIDTLANKFTAGVGEGQRATNFPMLAKELNMVSFSSPDARRMKTAISDLAEVFKNDVPLSQITGNVQVPKFQSYLTTDPVARAKYEIASKSFNYIKTLLPNKEQATLALVRKTAQLLENPLSSKSVKELMDEAAGRVDLSDDILKMQQEVARARASGRDAGSAKVKLYGNGSVLSAKAGSGAEHTIPLHRIATTEEALQIAEASGVNPADSKLLDSILAQYGYKAVQQGTDRVRVIK
ncbi:hypothetical protein MS_022 [Vibrio phage VPMS1]|uniref:hypothetical protein n=1 Tax=Vibrio phage VPMS1 TaxID=1233488 RepID=UPI00035848CA|nr:hypothetical protein MS_022 [Vibrio phage VPMS1]AFV51101.1 hypothetical protein MS_022 [Vibrio phage VPMS1]